MELVSIDETCHHIIISSMCIEDLQSMNSCQQIWDHLLQKGYTNFYVKFWKASFSKWRLFTFLEFLQLTVLRMRPLMFRCTILDIANILKINIFPSSAIFLSLHNFKIFCIFDAFHIFFFFCIYNFWLWEKYLPKIFIVSDV